MFFTIRLVFSILFSNLIQTANCSRNKVYWYLDHESIAANNKLTTNSSYVDGVFLCCTGFGISATGNWSSMSDSAALTRMKAINGRNAWFVIAPTKESILNGKSALAIKSMVSTARRYRKLYPNFKGYMVDYEPSMNYTDLHAKHYGIFLKKLSRAMSRHKFTVSMCIANWGIIKTTFYKYYQPARLEFYASMDITYAAAVNATYNYVPIAQSMLGKHYMAGIGSALEANAPYKQEFNFGQSHAVLSKFLKWLSNRNVSNIAIWPCNMDQYGRYKKDWTAKWFLETLIQYKGLN